MAKAKDKKTGRRPTPKSTGISDITGKTVRVRHADESDMVFIEEKLKGYHLDTGDLEAGQFVVATKDGEIIGFGRLKAGGDYCELGCLMVFDEKGHKGVDRLLVEHLLHIAPKSTVYVSTNKKGFFEKLGFKECPPELAGALEIECMVGGTPGSIMVYKKAYDR